MPKPPPAGDRKTFYLIDGHAQIYRAYHAPFRDLTSPTGEPTKATYVFTQVLLNLVETRKPDYLAMVIDAGGDEGVFRKRIDPNYKANRPKRPDDFAVQEARILQIVRDAGVPIYGVEGFEADDVLATLAARLPDQGFDVYLVSKDKDLRQSVREHVRMYDVMADETVDADALHKKLGYTPAQAVDVQTLVGDPTDNVPGVAGVGEKTAAKLIHQYGNAEAVVAHADELSPKLRENVRKFADQLPVTRQLVTLKTDVPLDFNPDDCEHRGLDTDALRSHLAELGFKSLLQRLGNGSGGANRTPPPIDAPPPAKYDPLAPSLFTVAVAPPSGPGRNANTRFHVVTDEKDLVSLADRLNRAAVVAFDTETDALDAVSSNVVGLSFAVDEGEGFYVPLKAPPGEATADPAGVAKHLRPILQDPNVRKIGHNLKFDRSAAARIGIDLRGVVGDTMIAAFLLDAGRNAYGLDRLAADLLGVTKIPTDSLLGKGKNQTSMDRLAVSQVAEYAAEDADVALRLHNRLTPLLIENPDLRALYDDVELPLIDVLAEMETNGITVDPVILAEQGKVLGERIDGLHARILQEAGVDFNPDSNKQLQDVLFGTLGLTPVRKTKTGYSTDMAVLEKLADEHPVPALILEYRSLQKLKNTYLDNLVNEINPTTKRIHTSFNQVGASTGRLSSTDPNLQNIPIRTDEGRRIRLAFVPGSPDQVLMTADYSQIELRMLAHYTGEAGMVRAFADDLDIHQAVAAEVFGVGDPRDVTSQQRRYAKTINFGIIYGVTAFGLSRRVEGLSQSAAAEVIHAYHRKFPTVRQFFEQCVIDAKRDGYVKTILGRRRPIPEIESRVPTMRQYAERTAINSVLQGSAADLIKIAMNRVYRRLRAENRPSRMLLQVHDELVFETPAAEVEAEAAAVAEEMTNAMTLKVPLKVETGWGRNWGEVKS